MARAFKENQTSTGAGGGKWGGIPARGNSTCKDVEVDGAEFSQETVGCCWLMQWQTEWEGLTATLRSDF